MSYIPGMKTVGSKLRDLFSTSGQTVESALPNEIEVSPSGDESSGLSVLTLYVNNDDLGSKDAKLYKNIELTEGYSSVEEVNEALLAAVSIRVVKVDEGDILGICFALVAIPANTATEILLPIVYVNDEYSTYGILVHIEDSGSGDPDPNDGGHDLVDPEPSEAP